MVFIWGYSGAHVLHMREETNWILYADHEYEEAAIYLAVKDQTYDLANEWEYLQGREHMHLDTYDIFEFYSAVVMKIAEMVCEDHVCVVNLEKVKEEMLSTYWWNKWKVAGRVTDDYR